MAAGKPPVGAPVARFLPPSLLPNSHIRCPATSISTPEASSHFRLIFTWALAYSAGRSERILLGVVTLQTILQSNLFCLLSRSSLRSG
jgi:hypothetical protein